MVLLCSLKGRALSCPLCFEKWSYAEVREAALLTEEERKLFEENMGFAVPVVKSGEAKHVSGLEIHFSVISCRLPHNETFLFYIGYFTIADA